MRRPKRLLFAIPLTLALTLTACSAESDSPSSESSEGGEAAATEGGTFSLNSSEPEAFAPTSNCYSSDCSQIINLVWTSLLKVDPETSEPELQMARVLRVRGRPELDHQAQGRLQVQQR